MAIHRILITILALAPCAVWAQCDSDAARAKVRERFSETQIADMRVNGHYKYMGLLLFYASSFEVKDEYGFRPASEQEIAQVDLHAHDGARRLEESVEVLDEQLQRVIRLLSRQAFEQLVMERYSDADRAAYLAYKASMLHAGSKRP
ncbi:MAG: hypothetical protein IPJ85_10865 [Flavobacteriales bacterium]|nr:hypothetical protein [Flavobacteriales bacterium]